MESFKNIGWILFQSLIFLLFLISLSPVIWIPATVSNELLRYCTFDGALQLALLYSFLILVVGIFGVLKLYYYIFPFKNDENLMLLDGPHFINRLAIITLPVLLVSHNIFILWATLLQYGNPESRFLIINQEQMNFLMNSCPK
jgi:hypothetical protein